MTYKKEMQLVKEIKSRLRQFDPKRERSVLWIMLMSVSYLKDDEGRKWFMKQLKMFVLPKEKD